MSIAIGHPAVSPFKSQAMKRYDECTAAIARNRARMAADRALFEQILELEWQADSAKVSLTFAEPTLPDYLWAGRKANADKSRAALFAAIDALSPAQAEEFGKYRARKLAERSA